MRGASIRIAGFLVLLALLVVPATAVAASGPPGTGFTPAGSILLDAADQATQPVAAELLRAADGALLEDPVSAEVAPAIVVSPASGPPGTRFVVTGTGFTPGSTVLFGAVDEATEPVAAELLQVAADGTFQTAIDSTGFAPGQYTVVVGTSDASALLASGTFTVTAGGAVGGGAGGGGTGDPTTMPRSGGGGMTPDAGPARLLPAGLAVVAFAACAALGAVAARRRRAH